MTLKLLADESCDFAIVRSLRAANCELKAVAEEMPGVSDLVVLQSAINENRLLLTEDKDFGDLFIKNPKQRLETALERHFWKGGIHFAHPMIEPVHDKPISQSSDRRRGLSSNVARI